MTKPSRSLDNGEFRIRPPAGVKAVQEEVSEVTKTLIQQLF